MRRRERLIIRLDLTRHDGLVACSLGFSERCVFGQVVRRLGGFEKYAMDEMTAETGAFWCDNKLMWL